MKEALQQDARRSNDAPTAPTAHRAVASFGRSTPESRMAALVKQRNWQADWLDARGIRWGGAKNDAKKPKSTRKGPRESWDVHFAEGCMVDGQQQWRSGKLPCIYLFPASLPLATEGGLAVDNDDDKHAEADLAFLDATLPKPVCRSHRPDNDGKVHSWYASDARTSNGNFWGGGSRKMGDLRGRTLKGTLGIGVRLYAGELEKLIRSIEAVERREVVPVPVTPAMIDALRARTRDSQPEHATGGASGTGRRPNGGRWSVQRVVDGFNAIGPGEGLHHNPALTTGVISIVKAGIFTEENYAEVAEPIEAAMRAAEKRGVNTTPRAAGFEKKELRDAFESALKECRKDPNWDPKVKKSRTSEVRISDGKAERCPFPDVVLGTPTMPVAPAASDRPGKHAPVHTGWLRTPEEVVAAWSHTDEARFHLYDAATTKAGRWMAWFPGFGWRPDLKGSAAKQSITRFSQKRYGVMNDETKKLRPDPVRGGSAAVVNLAYSLASSYTGMTLYGPDWDANPYLVGLPKARCHDLRDGSTRDQVPGDMLLLSTPVEPGDASRSGLRQIFHHGLRPEDVDGFERHIGSLMFGTAMGRGVAFIPGRRGVGKSLSMRRLGGALGPYAGVIEAKAVCVSARKEIAHTPQDRAARLRGVRVATVSEWAKGAKLDPVLFNEATGHDAAVARVAGGASSSKTPTWSAVMVMNSLPEIEAADDEAVLATFDRIRVYRFVNEIPKPLAVELWAKVADPKATGDDLAWLFDCTKRFVAEGHAPLSPAMLDEIAQWWSLTGGGG